MARLPGAVTVFGGAADVTPDAGLVAASFATPVIEIDTCGFVVSLSAGFGLTDGADVCGFTPVWDCGLPVVVLAPPSFAAVPGTPVPAPPALTPGLSGTARQRCA